MQKLIIGANNIVELQNLAGSTDGVAVTDATVEFTVYENVDTPVSGQVWPLAMGHVADGLYRGTMDATIGLDGGQTYRGIVEATAADGRKMTWKLNIKAEYQNV